MNALATTPYELWDTESGNCLGAYSDEPAALNEVREGIIRDGAEAWATVSLFRAATHGQEATVIAEGRLLIDRVRKAQSIVMIQGIPFNADQLANAAAALQMLDAIKQLDLEAMIRDVHAAFAAMSDDLYSSIDAIRAAADTLTRNSGVTVRLDTDGQQIALLTSDERMAGFLATQVSRMPGQVRMGSIENVYRIELTVAPSTIPRQIAS